MRKSVTKIVKAVLGFTMAIGAFIGVNVSNTNATPVNATTSNGEAETGSTFSPGASGEKYFICVESGNNYVYVPQYGTLDAQISGSNVSSSSILKSALSTVTEDMCWTIKPSNTSYTISYQSGGKTFYLGNTNTNNGMKVSETSQTWTISFSSSTATITGGNSRKLSYYNSADPYNWRCYSTSNGVQAIKLFRYGATKTLSGISVTTPPTKTKYIPTESFDSTGMAVTATYSDSSTTSVSLNDCTLNPTTITSAGNVTITYNGKTATQPVSVYSITNVTGVANGYPTQVDLNSTYLTKNDVLVNVACSDDEVIRTIHPTSISYDFSSIGTKTVTCTYSYASGTKTATFDVEVVDQGDGTEAKPYTVSKAYRIASALDAGAFHGSAVYITGIVSSTTDEIEINQTYHSGYFYITDGFETLYAYNVNKSTKTNEDGFVQIDQYYSVVIHADLKNQAGVYEIAYNNSKDKICEMVSSTAPAVVSIEANVVSKTRYVGDKLSVSDFVVTASYNNGKPSEVIQSGYTWTIGDGSSDVLEEGNNSVVVSYCGHDSSAINVVATEADAKDIVPTLSTQSSLTYHYSKTINTVDDALSKAFTGRTGTTYGDWTGNSSHSVSYSGNSAAGNDAIQLRTSGNSGIVITGNTNNRLAKVVTISWNSNTADGRKVYVYGKNEAYTSSANLYGDDKGTLIGYITKGTTTSLTIEDDYKFLGFAANGGALWMDTLTITWTDTASYSYTNTAVKFGGQIAATLWSRLNTESHGVLGYGVMLATEGYLSGLTIKNYYDLARDEKADVDSVFTEVDGKDYTLVDGLSIKCFYNEVSTMPRLVNGNYVWDLVKGVNNNNAGLTKGYTAVAFVRTTDDEIIFLQETTKSAAQVAKDIINADPDDEYDNDYLDGSLGHLAGLAV